MWRVCREAGRPWPILDDDPVVDYMVMEAVALRVQREDDARAKATRRRHEMEEERKRLLKAVR